MESHLGPLYVATTGWTDRQIDRFYFVSSSLHSHVLECQNEENLQRTSTDRHRENMVQNIQRMETSTLWWQQDFETLITVSRCLKYLRDGTATFMIRVSSN